MEHPASGSAARTAGFPLVLLNAWTQRTLCLGHSCMHILQEPPAQLLTGTPLLAQQLAYQASATAAARTQDPTWPALLA